MKRCGIPRCASSKFYARIYNKVYMELSNSNWVRLKVRAKFSMLPESESGWPTPITSKLRPNHNFFGPENSKMCMGEVTISNDEWIYPGESKDVIIHFCLLPEYAKLVKKGFRWRIQAASQYFANGEITEVISPPRFC